MDFNNSFTVELWTLRGGLNLTKDIRIKCLIVEVDALSVVQAMNSDKTNLLVELLLSYCNSLLKAISSKQVEHVY